ncbi:MAG: hypothetical protein SGJ20_14255 [Planctomycetota bacterium]|nr:hypothetical protein [Planctomycetota bacterium]
MRLVILSIYVGLATSVTVRQLASAATPTVCRPHVSSSTNLPTTVIVTYPTSVAVPVAPLATYWYGLTYPQSPGVNIGTTEELQQLPPISNDTAVTPQLPPALQQHCAKCHDAKAAGGFSLREPEGLSSSDRLSAIRQVLSGAMPPKSEKPLSTEERLSVLEALSK